MFSTPSGEYHLPKAVCFLAVPAFLALWIYFVIKALKSVSLSFWRLKSTIACAIGLGIVVVLAIGLVFYIITVQPEARGSIVPFVIAVLIALSGLAIFIFYSITMRLAQFH